MRRLVVVALLCIDCAAASNAPRTTSFATPPSTAIDIGGGVAQKVLRVGSGKIHPDAGSIVRLEFTGFRADGSEFDSSKLKGKPQVYELSKVVRGLSRAIQHMVAGESARFWIPADLAYGESPEDPRLPAGPLVFDIELLNIVRL
jgi:FKBP-type peptidyl-prolyl cis-trans isomerase